MIPRVSCEPTGIASVFQGESLLFTENARWLEEGNLDFLGELGYAVSGLDGTGSAQERLADRFSARQGAAMRLNVFIFLEPNEGRYRYARVRLVVFRG